MMYFIVDLEVIDNFEIIEGIKKTNKISNPHQTIIQLWLSFCH